MMASIRISTLIIVTLLLSNCSYLIEKQSTKLAEQLSETILNHPDPETVSSAIPSLLILVDSFASGEHASAAAQLSAAQLYGAYSGAFTQDRARQKTLTNIALDYARKGACQRDARWCDIETLNKQDFANFVDGLTASELELSYAYAVAWLSHIQAHSDDWNAVANLPKPKQLLESVVKYDEAYDHAGAHLYLAAIALSVPPALGGQPAVSRAHFERAIRLTEGRNLLIKVEYARRYARLIFDKDLHHQLLTEVLEAQAKQPGMTLMNAQDLFLNLR